MISGLRGIDQVAVVVRDLDASMREYVEKIGIGPWDVYIYGPDLLHTMTYRGERQPYVMKLALAYSGPTMYELIESVEGPNIYEEFLAERGVGLHHLGYYVDDIHAEIANMKALGYDLLQSGEGFGLHGDGAYAYFDTVGSLGCIIEAIERASELPPPERVYPAAG
jgi:catechol 2,3-dioxygenase-like lactoylglutathione lyase family enzyme